MLQLALLILGYLGILSCSNLAAGTLPAPTIPDGLGVSIHFRNPTTSEMQALSAAGIRWLRTDLHWHLTETQAGIYNFSQYDPLVTAANQYGMKLMLILCYTNPLYDGGFSPSTTAGRTAFANWAKAAVNYFKNRGYIWELYNEPNMPFWTSSAPMTTAQKATAYSQLALVTGPAIKNTFPNENLVGPSVGYFDGWNSNFTTTLSFLQTTMQQGLCNYFDAISVHPYRTVEPENVWSDYNKLKALIHNTTYNNTSKRPPVISGEWGYSSAWFAGDEAKKARFLSRSLLFNYACNVPISIVYDWACGADTSDSEQAFGIVAHYNRNVANPVITPLPAYKAIKTIYTQLNGYTFADRLNTGNAADVVLKFTNGAKSRYVAWNQAGQSSVVVIPAAPNVQITDTSYDGEWTGTYTAGATGGFTATLTSGPQFIVAAGQ